MRARALLLASALLCSCASAPPPATTPAPPPPVVTTVAASPIPPPPDPRLLVCGGATVGEQRDETEEPSLHERASSRAKVAPPRGAPAAPPPIQIPRPPFPPPVPVPPPPFPPPPPEPPRFVFVPQEPRLSNGPIPSSVTRGFDGGTLVRACASLATSADVGQYTLELSMSASGTPNDIRVSDNVSRPSAYLACVMQRACQVTAGADAFAKQLFLPFQVVVENPPPPPPTAPAALIDVTTVRSGGTPTDAVSTRTRALLAAAAERCGVDMAIPAGASVTFTLSLTTDPLPRSSLDVPGELDGSREMMGIAVRRAPPKPSPPFRPPVLPRVMLRVGSVKTQVEKGPPSQLVACMVGAVGNQTLPVTVADAKTRTESVRVAWPDGSAPR